MRDRQTERPTFIVLQIILKQAKMALYMCAFTQMHTQRKRIIVPGISRKICHDGVKASYLFHTWVSVTEHLNGSGSLGVSNLLVPLLQCVGLQPLPRQTPSQKVHKHVSQCLQVISPTLFCRDQRSWCEATPTN